MPATELDVELRIVEGLHHGEALERYRDADIVVDQLNAGWYGLFAIECMALGKPVVTFLHEEATRRTEEAFGLPVPIVNASAETLHDRLAELVALGPSGREEIGRASREYAERVHDLDRVTDQLLDVYATVLEPARERRRRDRGPAGASRPATCRRRCRWRTTSSTRRCPPAPGSLPPSGAGCAAWASRRSSGAWAATPRSTGSAGSSRA